VREKKSRIRESFSRKKEKAAILSGKDAWSTRAVPRLHIPEMTFSRLFFMLSCSGAKELCEGRLKVEEQIMFIEELREKI